MCRFVSSLAVVLMLRLLVVADAFATEPAAAVPPAQTPFLTENRILKASLERIARGSALWREALDKLARRGLRVVLITPYDESPWVSNAVQRRMFADGHLAEAVPLVRGDDGVSVVLVFVNLPIIRDAHDARFSAPVHFESDLDRILVHEIYGHGIPYLLVGNLSGRCADPGKNERADLACAIQRENEVRRELGLGRRGDEGLSSLNLGQVRVLRGGH
jgi:hypothetical protein